MNHNSKYACMLLKLFSMEMHASIQLMEKWEFAGDVSRFVGI